MALRLPAKTACRAAWPKNDYNTIMPRLGFSYDLFGNGKTILRAGFGTFYERIQGNDIYDAAGCTSVHQHSGCQQY